MSTKIYNAYKIPKTVDLHNEFIKIKNDLIDLILTDSTYFKDLHMTCVTDAELELFSYDKNNDTLSKNDVEKYKQIIDKNLNGKVLNTFIFLDFLKNKSRDWFNMCCKIFSDDDYFYLYFHIGGNQNEKLYSIVIDKLTKLGLVDYSYSDQVDKPDDISQRDYDKRLNKWNKFLDKYSTFSNGYEFNFIDYSSVKFLLFEDRINYKFDTTFI